MLTVRLKGQAFLKLNFNGIFLLYPARVLVEGRVSLEVQLDRDVGVFGLKSVGQPGQETLKQKNK